jgi:hypothetical protein
MITQQLLRTLAAVDSVAKQLAAEGNRHAEIEKHVDRMSTNVRRYVLKHPAEFEALLEYYAAGGDLKA